MRQPRQKDEFTRTELYDVVGSKPLRTIAHEHGLSDVGFAKACRSIAVLLPPRGYRAKLKAGKPLQRAKLPLRFPGAADEVTIGAGYSRWYGLSAVEAARYAQLAGRFADPSLAEARKKDITCKL
ncbi:MAG: hypothetical protein ACREHF_12160 [Rhizomicrobium sp.]